MRDGKEDGSNRRDTSGIEEEGFTREKKDDSGIREGEKGEGVGEGEGER